MTRICGPSAGLTFNSQNCQDTTCYFLSFCQWCLIDLIVGKRLKSQSYHARTWISPSKNRQFLEVFPPESWASAKRQTAPGPSQRDVQLPTLDPAAVERLPRWSRHRGDCPEAGRSGLRAIEMNYMAKLRPDLYDLWSFSFHSDEDGDAYRY